MTHENGTEALPLVVDAVTAQARESKKTASVPSVAFGFCPDCNRADQRGRKQTGLLRVGAHLVWRHHNVVTWGGVRRPCRTVGVPVCQVPTKVSPLVRCPCVTKR